MWGNHSNRQVGRVVTPGSTPRLGRAVAPLSSDAAGPVRPARRRRLTREQAEQRVNDFFRTHLAEHGSGTRALLLHPVQAVSMLMAVLHLPVLVADLGQTPEGRTIRSRLMRSATRWRSPLRSTTAVLALPATHKEYLSGASKQTLRRKIRRAESLGVRWRAVDDPAERARLRELADERERETSAAPYAIAGFDNSDLPAVDLWLAAYDAAGAPLLVSVTPVDGEWAVLRYFRTFVDSEEASVARYLMTSVLADELIRRGVRYLADTWAPATLPNGLRHFQRMLGFTIHRVHVRPVRGSVA